MMMHLKAVRVFVESVLRYDLPYYECMHACYITYTCLWPYMAGTG